MWPYPAVATGVGSMPGEDPREAMNVVAGEFADFVHLVELPARGPGADRIGRTAAMLASVDRAFDIETTPSGWRLGHAGQSLMRRAGGYLSQDLDALEEYASTSKGPVKAAVAGPWSLAAAVADPAGEALLRDPGAVTDLTGALAAALGDLVARLRRALPSAELVIQLDDDTIPQVLQGHVRTSSGRLTHRSVEPLVVQAHLRTVVDAIHNAGARAAIRCFASSVPVDVLIDTGVDALALRLDTSQSDAEALPRVWESTIGLLLACVPATHDATQASDTDLSAPLRRFMSESGFASVPDNVAVTPSRGLAHLGVPAARAVIAACNRVGSIVRDDVESSHAS